MKLIYFLFGLLLLAKSPFAQIGIITEDQKLTASDSAPWGFFGAAAAVDGQTMVLGSSGDHYFGSAYVFTLTSSGWQEQQKLTGSDSFQDDRFGAAVAIDGDTLVIGAPAHGPGAAYVFTRTPDGWAQQQKLTAANATQQFSFGARLAVDGDSVLIGAPGDDHAGTLSGSAFVFTRANGVWTEHQKLIASNPESHARFGGAISMDGNVAAIGAWESTDDSGYAKGSVYVFTCFVGVWEEQQELVASDGEWTDYFGWAVSLDQGTLLIGAPGDDDGGDDSGSAYVFVNTERGWQEQQKLTASDATPDDDFAEKVAVDGDTVVIGAMGWTEGTSSRVGSAYLFRRAAGIWTEQWQLAASDAASWALFGSAVAVDGNTAVVGAAWQGGDYVGSAYVFAYGLVFSDSFEDGTTSSWTSAVGIR